MEDFILVYVCISMITLLIEGLVSGCYQDLFTPRFFYDNSKMNWFGCWFCFILLSVVSPFGLILKVFIVIIYVLWTFIEWLFTVGRKD